MSQNTPLFENPLLQFIAEYRRDSVRFVIDVFGVEPDEWQRNVLRAYDRGDRRISIRSGHGVGKTTLLAWIVVHFILTRFPQKTICTAPTSAQLFDALAAEVKAWIGKLPDTLKELLEIQTDRIQHRGAPQESFISFRTSRPEVPEALAGVHSDNVLLLCDEASGIPDTVYEAGSGSMSGHNALTILAGNPIRSSGLFYDTHHKLRDLWTTFVVSCKDSPRIAQDFIDDMARRYGEKSNAFRVRVLGEFPLADDDTVIPFELMEAALKRDVKPHPVRPIWGVDCARFGQDRSALAKRQGNSLMEPVKTYNQLDTMELVGRVKAEWDATTPSTRPEEICVDAIGLGAGVADRLRELGLPARAINVAESPAMGDQFRNLRAELWFKARDWLAKRDCNLCGDEALGAELITPKYKFTSNGKRQVESKDEMKKRGFPSPDLADAFIMTLASDASTALLGGQSLSWREPLKRIISGIV